ncbi:AGE family epimerase/isomerase [Stieleria varia]|uniref:Cellobiose 2-epimerase n=1 Tax=Stieleria varia TaxID=2528005 RepID=A0A5C5ZM53_9BACT|nr:AGE family epimerase/isomerase [Stieleria varia]TWT88057.1 Cellobiose 2-epimerase [Stieleria varia]
MSPDRLDQLRGVYRDGLLGDTLPFWTEHCVDSQHGGFMMSLDRDGTVLDTDKGVWQQCRFTWLLAELYNNVQPNQQWLDLAQHGCDFIDRHCFDPSDGRMWFHVTRDGEPIRKRRYAFSEAFAAIAYGELFQATGDDSYRTKAVRAFEGFVKQSLHPKASDLKFTGTRSMKGLGVPMITIITAQELRDSIGMSDANEWIDRSIETIRRDHMRPELECVLENVGPDGQFIDHFDGRLINPGHSIEGAWFIMNEGKYRSDTELIQLGCRMLDWSWQRGWDSQYGGMLYFVDAKGLPVQEYWHDMKFWWPQNETIIATLLAYHLTGDTKYAHWHQLIHDWAYSHFPDRQHGEWYGYLHRDGRLSSPVKGNLWKGPFHLPRMQLMCWRLAEQ